MSVTDLPRYRDLELIGEGGLGKVFRAFDATLNRKVAIKKIKTKADGGAGSQLLAEAKLLSAVQHPNIVTIHDLGRWDDELFIVMELIQGEDFETLLRGGRILYESFVPFCLQLQEAIIAAHHLGILHCDLKPANVMLSWLPSGSLHVKLVDFGLAELRREAEARTKGKLNIAGSLYFMSPEQFESGPLDVRSDLYGLGCLYYYILARRHPFDGDTPAQVMASHILHDVQPLSRLRPDLPPWLCDWVMWHIQRKPADRPPSALDAFDRFTGESYRRATGGHLSSQ